MAKKKKTTRSRSRKKVRVAIIGAGTVGASWTALFLSRGMSAAVYDPDPDTAQRVERMIKSAWPVLERIGIADAADPTAMPECPIIPRRAGHVASGRKCLFG